MNTNISKNELDLFLDREERKSIKNNYLEKVKNTKVLRIIALLLLFIIEIPFFLWFIFSVLSFVGDGILQLIILLPFFLFGCSVWLTTKYLFPKTHQKLYG